MNKKYFEQFIEFLNKYSIRPKKISDYDAAFTHPSFVKSSKVKSFIPDYQRLEFLGDSVLQFLTSNHLFLNNKNIDAGHLTLMRAKLVSTENLYAISKQLNLSKYLKTGDGQTASQVINSKKVNADIFESFIGALYLDQGLQKVKTFLSQTLFKTKIDLNSLKDPKTSFQEYMQAFSKMSVIYETIQQNSSFISKATHSGNVYGMGRGKNKQEAEENAAKDALAKLAANRKDEHEIN